MQVKIHADSTRTIPGSRHYIHVKDVVKGLKFILSLPKEYKNKGTREYQADVSSCMTNCLLSKASRTVANLFLELLTY